MTNEGEIFYPLEAAVEDIEEYRPGDYHPLYLGDSLHGDRYLVLRKLSYGSSSTTWLARDRKYVLVGS
jgi:serine/threonine-protein kinase SRPK3